MQPGRLSLLLKVAVAVWIIHESRLVYLKTTTKYINDRGRVLWNGGEGRGRGILRD